VIHGNYDTYERMRALQEESAPQQAVGRRRSAGGGRQEAVGSQKQKRKRKFPYRKVEDLEADIAAAETTLRVLEERLASPDLYRDGDKVKETTKAFAETKAKLQQLYEHWEEAVELN
jgi:ATP-binding cassette subfamily F protein 3